jgi:hypothetical protein
MQVVAFGENTIVEGDPRKSLKPLENREAMRKYWEKKKAQSAFLEEVRKLRMPPTSSCLRGCNVMQHSRLRWCG